MTSNDRVSSFTETHLSRRRFVKGVAAGSLLCGLGAKFPLAYAQNATPYSANILQGNSVDLRIAAQRVNFTGTSAMATTINGSLPAPTLRWKEGELITIRVNNQLRVDSSIHWHGLILPANMDGVPGLSFDGIAPGETFTYQFKAQQSGTYWYHSHSGHQEQTGLYGAIIIDPKEPEPFRYDRDYVILLSDWSDEDPAITFRKLKKLDHYYNYNERTVADLWRDISEKGVLQTWRDRQMWNQMRMNDRDISDVTGSSYTFLMNGMTPAAHWRGLFAPGEKIRLRFINAGAMTFFDARIPGLKMTVVAADGQYVQPVSVDEFRIAPGETYDVIVEPRANQPYCVFAQAIDRSGYACGSLTPDEKMLAAIPAMDAKPVLSHADMGMGHGEQHAEPAAQSTHAEHGSHQSHGNHAAPSNSTNNGVTLDSNNPLIDMIAQNPQYRLDDPGVGLRNNGRRVLTYADLRSPNHNHHTPAVDREIVLQLTGNMKRYHWSIDGIPSHHAPPLQWRLGERVRVTFINNTMMNHPMHLHGMWSELETGDAMRLPKKHTIIVQPGAKISYQVNVDAAGDWAFHCHLMHHMMGMFRVVRVA
ncbi:MAG: copper resistance system multicopper oxidase [Gammaproteobacteria bacterium]|nr:copper resistance system multicopper oxidase [Gammaproteobacteria bacterium]